MDCVGCLRWTSAFPCRTADQPQPPRLLQPPPRPRRRLLPRRPSDHHGGFYSATQTTTTETTFLTAPWQVTSTALRQSSQNDIKIHEIHFNFDSWARCSLCRLWLRKCRLLWLLRPILPRAALRGLANHGGESGSGIQVRSFWDRMSGSPEP